MQICKHQLIGGHGGVIVIELRENKFQNPNTQSLWFLLLSNSPTTEIPTFHRTRIQRHGFRFLPRKGPLRITVHPLRLANVSHDRHVYNPVYNLIQFVMLSECINMYMYLDPIVLEFPLIFRDFEHYVGPKHDGESDILSFPSSFVTRTSLII